MSHAKWPKDNHEYASTQIGRVIWRPLKAVEIEWRARQAMSSQNAQRSYERYLALAHAEVLVGDTVGAGILPARRTLFQIDVARDSERA